VPDIQIFGARRGRAIPLSTVLSLTPEGLVLGAGTVLLRAEGPRRLQSLAGRQARLLGLLSAAYGRAVAVSVLGNIERAAKLRLIPRRYHLIWHRTMSRNSARHLVPM
jgi:hypothetical protein